MFKQPLPEIDRAWINVILTTLKPLDRNNQVLFLIHLLSQHEGVLTDIYEPTELREVIEYSRKLSTEGVVELISEVYDLLYAGPQTRGDSHASQTTRSA